MPDILALENQVARAIAGRIRVELSPQEQARLTSAPSLNPEAHDLYLKGRYNWSKRTEEGVNNGIEYFQRALEKDPNYALAYAGLADSYTEPAFLGVLTLSPKDAMAKARAAATRALELDDTLAEAHTAMALVKGIMTGLGRMPRKNSGEPSS